MTAGLDFIKARARFAPIIDAYLQDFCVAASLNMNDTIRIDEKDIKGTIALKEDAQRAHADIGSH